MREGSARTLSAAVAFTALSVGLLVVSLHGVDVQHEGSTGLVSVLPKTYFLALLALSLGFVLALSDSAHPWWLPGLQTVVLVVATGGLGSIVETAPRIAVTYTHLGFAQFIETHGQPIPPIDARADWPGAFALLAFLEAISGSNFAFAIGRWAPLFFDLLWVFPLVMLCSIITANPRAKWIGAWIFLLANWTEEDYLSPQAFDFTLYLVIIAILLAAFGKYWTRRRSAAGHLTKRARVVHDALSRWGSLRHPSREAPTPWTNVLGPATRVTLLILTLLLAAIATISHQLTPYMLILVSAALVVFGRLRIGAFPWAVGVMAVGWLSFGAISFWSGHLSLLFGGAGNVGQNFSSGVTGRIQGTLGHRLVLACRFGIALAVIGTAIVAWFRDHVRGRTRVWLLAGMVAPAFLVAVQNYGGEGVIRSYLFLLPFAAALAAMGISEFSGSPASNGPSVPSSPFFNPGFIGIRQGEIGIVTRAHVPSGSRLRRALLISLAVVVTAGAAFIGVVARYGSDQVDQVSQGELTTMAWFYKHVPTRTAVYTVCVNLPWRYEQAASYQYRSLPATTYTSPSQILRALSPDGLGSYLITTPRQGICEEQLDGLPDDWLRTLRANLQKTGRSRTIYSVNGNEIDHILPKMPTSAR